MTRREVFDLMRSAYNARSKVVHGDVPRAKDMTVKGTEVSLTDFVQATEDVVRQGLQEALAQGVQHHNGLAPRLGRNDAPEARQGPGSEQTNRVWSK